MESFLNSRLSRSSTARESCSGLAVVGPTKVKATISFLFTEGSLKVKIKNNCYTNCHLKTEVRKTVFF